MTPLERALEQMNHPPQQRYSGPEAIARRDAVLRSRPRWTTPPVKHHESTGTYTLTEKDLGT